MCLPLSLSLSLSIRFSRGHPAVIAAAAAAAAAATAANPNGTAATTGTAGPPNRGKNPVPQIEEVENTSTDAPWKLVAVSSKVQFTCGLKDISMGGRADFKAIKTVIRCAEQFDCLSLSEQFIWLVLVHVDNPIPLVCECVTYKFLWLLTSTLILCNFRDSDTTFSYTYSALDPTKSILLTIWPQSKPLSYTLSRPVLSRPALSRPVLSRPVLSRPVLSPPFLTTTSFFLTNTVK